MNRREALVSLTALFGGTLFGAQRLLAGTVNATTAGRTLSTDHLALLNEIAETILPATAGSPGAKAANLAGFMQEIVRDYYSDGEFAVFAGAAGKIDDAARTHFGGRGFAALNPQERFDHLMTYEGASPVPDHYRMIKQLTLWGYFTSEIGQTQALAHVAVPGRYQGCITVNADTRAWAQ